MSDVALGVVSVHLSPKGGIAILSNGETVPITNFYDDDGNDVELEGDVAWFVCGPSNSGWWFTEQLSDFRWKKHLDS